MLNVDLIQQFGLDGPGSTQCSDIYDDEIRKSINALKRFQEAWHHRHSSDYGDLFEYADPEFQFYRFTIDRLEKSTESLLCRILYKMMERYGIDFLVPQDDNKAPFCFIIREKD